MEKDAFPILVIKLRAIGDVVLSTAVLPNLRRAYPDSPIHFLTERSGKEVLSGHRGVDRIVVQPPDPWVPGGAWWRAFGFLRWLRKQRYGLVIDLFGNPRSAFLTRFTGARIRAGYDFRGRRFAYNRRIPPRGDRVHEVEFNLDALRRLDIPVSEARPCFPFSAADAASVGTWLRANRLDGKPLAAIHPWGSWPAKRWGTARFAELARALVRRFGANVVVLWGPGEKEHAETVRDAAGDPVRLAPPMTLKELGALLSKCDLVVANDSGPMHIAAAVGAPTVGLFGPTRWQLQGPYGASHAAAYSPDVDCLGCNRMECRNMACMERLGVDAVLEVAAGVMRKNGIRRRTR
jgi:ADP-heptose:LPS heptosyltransferase